MLDFMRRNARSWAVKAALSIIVAVFILFMGKGYMIGKGQGAIATVGKIQVTLPEFQLAKARNETYFRNQFQGQMNDQLLKALDIPSMTLRQLVDGAALRGEAQRLGLNITDEAVRDSLRRIDAFQRGGVFSPTVYKEVVRSQGMSTGMFEESVRRDMLGSQLADIIRRGTHVSEDEAYQEYLRLNRKMTLAYLELDTMPLAEQVVVDEAALNKFFGEHNENYRRPESVSVRYIAYKVSDYAAKTTVSDEEISDYYDVHKNAEFSREEQVAARHILKRVAEDADEATKKAARDAIDAVAARLAAGEDFETVAKAESQDPGSASKGGDLGFFGRGRMVPAFEKAAFSLERGKVSDVFESDFGFHVLQVYDKKPAGTATLDEVKGEIRTKIAEQKASDKVFEDAAADAAGLADGAKFDTLAQERGVKIEETPLLSKGAIIPGVGDAPAFFQAADALEKPGDSDSQPVKVGRDYYVISLGSRKDSYIPQFAEARDAVEKDYRKEQGLDAGRKRADEWLAAAKSGTSLEQIAQQNQLEVKKSESFTADAKVVGGLGAIAGLGEVAFKTAKDGEPLARTFVSGNKGYVFARDSVSEGTRDDFDQQKDEMFTQLRKQREQAALDEFIRDLKEKAKISYNLAELRPLLGDQTPKIE